MNNENQYLNEEKYMKNKNKIKKVGKILLIIGIVILILGIVLQVIGFIGFGSEFNQDISANNVDNTFGTFGLISGGMFSVFIGVSLMMAGGISMIIAHSREINEFSAQSTIPVAKEAVNEMAPSAGTVAKEVTKGIKEGLDDKE